MGLVQAEEANSNAIFRGGDIAVYYVKRVPMKWQRKVYIDTTSSCNLNVNLGPLVFTAHVQQLKTHIQSWQADNPGRSALVNNIGEP